jgi:hypothetical protein
MLIVKSFTVGGCELRRLWQQVALHKSGERLFGGKEFRDEWLVVALTQKID